MHLKNPKCLILGTEEIDIYYHSPSGYKIHSVALNPLLVKRSPTVDHLKLHDLTLTCLHQVSFCEKKKSTTHLS